MYELCYMLQSGDLDIFLSKGKEKERKKKKEEKDCWEAFMFDTSCWLNISGIFKKKKEKKKELFLKSYHYLFGRRLLKYCCVLNAPLCWNLLVVISSADSSSVVRICFSLISLSLILAERLIATLKHYKRILEVWLQLIFSKFEVRFFLYLRGYENEGFGGVCESELVPLYQGRRSV